jgi:hypothetical protein
MPREAKELKALSRSYVRPTKAELRLLQKAFEAADREDRGVQMSYVRRQLVRLVLPDVIHFGAVLNAASARNADLLRTMGVDPSQAALSPKVLSELLVPLTPPAIDVVLATVTLQRVWRSIACRAKVQPSLTQRLIRLRASTRMQRWWRWWLVKERLRMLRLVRERVIATTSNKLYLPTAVYEDLKGKYPLHAKGLWPEHSSLKFTFAHTHEQNLQYFVLPDALRPEMPHWAAPRIPIARPLLQRLHPRHDRRVARHTVLLRYHHHHRPHLQRLRQHPHLPHRRLRLEKPHQHHHPPVPPPTSITTHKHPAPPSPQTFSSTSPH